jgi:hypothetical protein
MHFMRAKKSISWTFFGWIGIRKSMALHKNRRGGTVYGLTSRGIPG